jgi:hypothetical protein
MNVMLHNRIKQLQDVSLRETYPIPHLMLAELHACHMVYLAIHEILLPLWLVLISGSRNYLSGRALPCKVTSQPALETWSSIAASLSWCIM